MQQPSDDTITLPRLILVEGPDDIHFFRALITTRNLHDCHIRSTGLNRHEKGGNSKFGDKLASTKVARGYKLLKHILLVTDADSDPQASFDLVRDQVAAEGFAAPAGANVASNGTPAITIVVLPFQGEGTLESYCIEAARDADANLTAHVDAFQGALNTHNWSTTRKGKFWLRTMLAAHCKKDPMVNLGPALTDYRHGNPIALKHKSFNGIAKIVSDLK